jgi:tripartite-type tricarboxylate transporter receptor subunit TctC
MNPARTLRGAAALLTAALSMPGLAADTPPFPAKPVRFVVPTAPGGNADIVARIAAEGMSRELGQSVYVDNQAGGRQIPGTQLVARANPDGHTLIAVGLAFTANAVLYNDLPYDPVKDFAPVGVVGSTPLLVVACNCLPAGNMKELIALAKAKPGAINYASAGVGSPAHLGGELLNSMAGIRLTHVPYKATAQANNDTMTGVVQLSLPAAASIVSLVKAGKLKALGIGSLKRSPQMPEVPAIAETLPGYEVQLWNGMEAPAATPRPVIARLNGALNKALATADIKEKLVKAGLDIDPQTPEEMAAYIDAEIRKWTKVTREAGIKGER